MKAPFNWFEIWFVASGVHFALFMWTAMLLNRHFKRDVMTRRSEWRWAAIRADLADHLRQRIDLASSASEAGGVRPARYFGAHTGQISLSNSRVASTPGHSPVP